MSHLSSVAVGQSDLSMGGCIEASHAASTDMESPCQHGIKSNPTQITLPGHRSRLRGAKGAEHLSSISLLVGLP